MYCSYQMITAIKNRKTKKQTRKYSCRPTQKRKEKGHALYKDTRIQGYMHEDSGIQQIYAAYQILQYEDGKKHEHF